jgi:hypothetical protein
VRWAALLVVTALPLAACGDDEVESEAVPAPTTTTATSVAAGGRCPQAPDGSSPSTFDAAAGTYAAQVTAFDPATGMVSFDVVQWLVGPEAVAAFQADNPGESEGPPNDYYVVNVNDEVRTAPVGAAATVNLVRLATDGDAGVNPGTVEELPNYLAATPGALYWLSFLGGEIVELCEQYVP